MKDMINQAIQFRFQEDIHDWIDLLNDAQLHIIQTNLYTVDTLEELKQLIK